MGYGILVAAGLCIFLFSSIIVAEGIVYDFDEVEVVYAAEFTITPIGTDTDNWLVQLAGGPDKPVNVLYGVVNLKKGGQTGFSEEFIKVTGETDSERFLMNSGRWDYYEGTGKYRQIATFFWSAKKLVGNSVIKDFTLPIKSLSLFRRFDENQNIDAIVLTASNDGQTAVEEFWTYNPFQTTTTTVPTTTTTTIPKERTTTTSSTTTTTSITTTIPAETTTTLEKVPEETTTTTIKEEPESNLTILNLTVTENVYRAELETLIQVGDPIAKSEV